MSGNFPVLLETAKVVETNVIDAFGGPAKALHPPVIAILLHHIPAVEWVAPALAGDTEIVWGDAADRCWIQVSVELEQVRIRPDIGAVIVEEDGDIADHANRTFGSVVAQRVPLLKKEELHDPVGGENLLEFARRFLHGCWLSASEF